MSVEISKEKAQLDRSNLGLLLHVGLAFLLLTFVKSTHQKVI